MRHLLRLEIQHGTVHCAGATLWKVTGSQSAVVSGACRTAVVSSRNVFSAVRF